jgi:hypothetical protein
MKNPILAISICLKSKKNSKRRCFAVCQSQKTRQEEEKPDGEIGGA